MIYKNDPEEKERFIKRFYLTMGIAGLIGLSVFFLLLNYLSMDKSIIYLSLSIMAVLIIALILIGGIIKKKNYDKNELELSETELILRADKFQWLIKLNELAKVDSSKSSRTIVYDIKGNSIIINDYLIGFEEINEILSSKEIPEANKKLLKKNRILKYLRKKGITILLLIFCIIKIIMKLY